MGTMANSEDQDEMQHKAAFHQDMHCLLRQIRSSGKEIHFWGEIITCGPTLYTIDHLDLVFSFGGNSIGLQRINP